MVPTEHWKIAASLRVVTDGSSSTRARSIRIEVAGTAASHIIFKTLVTTAELGQPSRTGPRAQRVLTIDLLQRMGGHLRADAILLVEEKEQTMPNVHLDVLHHFQCL